MYNIVKKFSEADSVIKSDIIGYVDEEDKFEFETIQGTPLVDWVEANPSSNMVDYFVDHDPCYLIDSIRELPEGCSLITNLTNPEEV